MNDIIIPILLKVDQRGILYIAMQYIYVPACNKIFLELPAYKVLKRDNDNEQEIYTKNDIEYTIKKILEKIQYKRIYSKELSTNFEAISQSITDQMAKFMEIEVEYKESKEDLQWYPINSLNDLVSRQDINMSIQTKYGLMLFQDKYKEELSKVIQTKFYEDKILLNKRFNVENKYQKKDI